MADCKDNPDKINDLMICDQMYNGFHKDLVAFLKERKPLSVHEVATLAEQYREAHPNRPMIRSIVSHETFGATAMHDNKERSQSRGRYSSRSHFNNGNKPFHDRHKNNENRYAENNTFNKDRNNYDQSHSFRQERCRGGHQYRQTKSFFQNQNRPQQKQPICFRCQVSGHIAKYCTNDPVANVAYHVSPFEKNEGNML